MTTRQPFFGENKPQIVAEHQQPQQSVIVTFAFLWQIAISACTAFALLVSAGGPIDNSK
jgi:hypothetical protein